MFATGTARKPKGMSELEGVWEVKRSGGLLPPLTARVEAHRRHARHDQHRPRGRRPVRRGRLRAALPRAVHRFRRRPDARREWISRPRHLHGARVRPLRADTDTRRRHEHHPGTADQASRRGTRDGAERPAHARRDDLDDRRPEDPAGARAPQDRDRRARAPDEGRASLAHGAAPSTVRQLGGILGALAKMPLDLVRGEKAGRNARDGYATEHMEIASYELLKRVAQRAGDDETVTACDEIIGQEQAMADLIAANWDTFAELSLREEGVTAA